MEDALAVADPANVIITTDYAKDDLPRTVRRWHQERPAHLCSDTAPMSLVLKYVCREMYPMDTVLLFQPNVYHPERVWWAKRCVEKRLAGTSVRYPDFWHPDYALGKKGLPKVRQALEPAYRTDGLIYRVPVAHLLLIDPFVGTYAPVEGTINVDTEDDWLRLEATYGTVNL